MENITKNQYLDIRKKLQQGRLDNTVLEFLYNHWLKYKKDEYDNITRDEFDVKFVQYLRTGFAFNSMANKIFHQYDNEFNVTYVRDKSNRLLTII